jgi:asparagine synthase (glutamine-hydrolysing)
MIRQLRHRGPDGVGFYAEGRVGLAHARLSIIDMKGGAQPIHNEDRSVWVVFNGEIFNYLELRAELETRGHRFYTRSDTEVIVHLYEELGEGFLHRLNGQFAIALWDDRCQTLLLARDRVGIAPLFHAQRGGELLFGSEVKAILAATGESPRLDLRALDQIFTFWAPVAPRTLFDGVQELPPGHWLRICDGKVESRCWWDFEFPEDGGFDARPENELADELRARLDAACRLRLRADVPVAAYLSGGLDSSIIAAIVHGIQPQALRTFSIGFEGERLDETAWQQAVVRHLGTEHHAFSCDRATVAGELATTVWHGESAILRTAPVPMRLLSARVRAEGYRVVLTGEGADEILGGYDLFKEAKIRQFWAVRPDSHWRARLLQRLYPYLDLSRGDAYLRHAFGQSLDAPESPWFSHLPRWAATSQTKAFFSAPMLAELEQNSGATDELADRLPRGYHAWHPFNRAQYLESKLLMGGYLLAAQGDRMLMANGVEGRFPYLDHELIAFAARLHPRVKMRVLKEKHLLRRAMGRLLPRAVTDRHKQPYRAPDIDAFRDSRAEVYALMEPGLVRDYGYFDSAKVEFLVRKAMAGRALGQRDNMAFIGVLTTQMWHREFIDRFGVNFGAHSGAGEPTREHQYVQ